MKLMTRGAVAALLTTIALPAAATECIAPANPGGGWDFTCRQIGRIMTDLELVPNMVQVTNLGGAGGGVAYAQVVSKRGDDPDLFVAASSSTTTRLAQNAYAGATADQVRWVGSIAGDPGVIVVAQDSPIQNLTDLVEAVKADPAAVAFAGGSAVGGFDHLKVLRLMQDAGVEDVRQIKYIGMSGGAEAITQTVGGFAQAMTGDLSEITGFIRSGDVRPIAVMAENRAKSFPDLPTAKEQGVETVAMNWRGIYVPKDISDEDYQRWVDQLTQVGQSEEWKAVMAENGLEPYLLTGAEFQTFIQEDIAEITDLSREIGLVQ